jgi:DNA-binding GntR family transcriptional regulator
VLEGAAVAAMAHLFTPEDFAAMEKLVDDMARYAEEGVPMEKIASMDDAFHERLFSHCDNALIRQLSRRSCQGISKFLLYKYWCKAFRADEMHGRHKSILDAVKRGDAARIEKTLRDHYQDAGMRMATHGSDLSHKENLEL